MFNQNHNLRRSRHLIFENLTLIHSLSVASFIQIFETNTTTMLAIIVSYIFQQISFHASFYMQAQNSTLKGHVVEMPFKLEKATLKTNSEILEITVKENH